MASEKVRGERVDRGLGGEVAEQVRHLARAAPRHGVGHRRLGTPGIAADHHQACSKAGQLDGGFETDAARRARHQDSFAVDVPGHASPASPLTLVVDLLVIDDLLDANLQRCLVGIELSRLIALPSAYCSTGSGMLPIAREALPSTSGALPAAWEGLPRASGTLPSAWGALPHRSGNVSHRPGNAPHRVGTTSHRLGSIPQRLGCRPYKSCCGSTSITRS